MEKSIKNTHKELKERWVCIKNELKEDSSVDLFLKVYLIYNERIDNRYFKPIELLRDHKDSSDGFGFSMVAILCSLIEFLQSTIDGKFDKKAYENEFNLKYSVLQNEKRITYYEVVNNNEDNEFVIFLKKLDSRFEKNPDYSAYYNSVAREFYECIRCAILHDACTRNNWIIREKSGDNSIFDISKKEEKILYRNDFYNIIKEKVKKYMKEQFVENKEIRKNLFKKMDIIFETANYNKFEDIPFWWN